MSIGERLKNLRQNLDITVKEMSDILGIPTRTIGGYERDENPPNEKFLTLLLVKFNVNINWLLTGNGSIFIQKEDDFVEFLIGKYSLSKENATDIIKLIENKNTKELILRFAKAKSGDTEAIDILMQNLAGMKAIFS